MSNQKNIQVLIAENNYLVAQMVKGLLIKLGYTVIGNAADGLQAVERTQSLKPDVVIMDIKMPDMDGIEATRQIFKQCPTPVVMVTAYEDQSLVEQASAAGAGAYIVKPAQAPELERAITIAMSRFRDMIALRRMNDELQQLNQELMIQNQELDSFSHTVAHDLKNPLHLLIGYAELLQADLQLSEDDILADVPEAIVQSARKMNNIIEELLLLAGVRKAVYTPEPLEMESIIIAAKYRLSRMVTENQAEFIISHDWPISEGYAPWIEEVWANYISNAIKYGGTPPKVELGATTQEDGMIRFWVQDNGPGIPLEKQQLLFLPFNRLSQIRAKGHGLGLSIVHRIIKKLGGTVGLESVEGQGSCFYFTLPPFE